MLRKLAVKRLTESDLTLFEWHFRRVRSNQKAINLNANVFIDNLYPGLPAIPTALGDKIPLDLFIYGPGMEGEYNLQRKIVKGRTYKNWRLDGEFIFNPPECPNRFDILVEGDLAVFEFFGDVRPESARVVFLGARVSEDKSLHTSFSSIVGSRPNDSMVALTPGQLASIVKDIGVPDEHPIFGLISLDSSLEVATLGDKQRKTRLRSVPSGRKVSRDMLLRARSNADRIGELGEQFVNSYLTKRKAGGAIENFGWTSRENATSPYDFWYSIRGQRILLDSKATELSFESSLHVSLSELRQMGYGSERYDLYRVFEMSETTAKLKVSEDLGQWARSIIEVLENLPSGVLAESVTVSPLSLPFGPEVEIRIPDEPEE
jgi:hypothetical protein